MWRRTVVNKYILKALAENTALVLPNKAKAGRWWYNEPLNQNKTKDFIKNNEPNIFFSIDTKKTPI